MALKTGQFGHSGRRKKRQFAHVTPSNAGSDVGGGLDAWSELELQRAAENHARRGMNTQCCHYWACSKVTVKPEN
jgi:hypothetical protein